MFKSLIAWWFVELPRKQFALALNSCMRRRWECLYKGMYKKKLSFVPLHASLFYQALLLFSDQAAKQQELARQAEAMKAMCHQTPGYRWHWPITHGVLWLTVALWQQTVQEEAAQAAEAAKKEKDREEADSGWQGDRVRQQDNPL